MGIQRLWYSSLSWKRSSAVLISDLDFLIAPALAEFVITRFTGGMFKDNTVCRKANIQPQKFRMRKILLFLHKNLHSSTESARELSCNIEFLNNSTQMNYNCDWSIYDVRVADYLFSSYSAFKLTNYFRVNLKYG